MAEYRPIPPERLGEARAMMDDAFSPTEPAGSYEDPADLSRRDRMGAHRGLFDAEGTLLSVCKQFWHTVGLRGDDHPVAGLAGVATPVEHRRRGHVARLVAESLEEYRDRGHALAALWPFDFEFYRRYGWARAGTHATHECAPAALRFAGTSGDGSVADEGTFRRLDARGSDGDAPDTLDAPDAEVIDALDAVLDAHNEHFECTMRRTEEWWRYRIFETFGPDPFVYAWAHEGTVRGYVAYTITEESGEFVLETTDMAYTDREAWVHLLRLLANHDAQVERVRLHGPPHTWLLDLADDPEAIESTRRAGPMVRIVDVKSALEALSYPPDAAGEFTLDVTDSTADWNDGTFAVSVTDGAATCRSLESPGDTAGPGTGDAPEVTIDINTLSQLYVGHCSVERAGFTGNLSIADPETERLLDDLFPPGDVYLREFF